MATLVLDCSVAISWFLPDETSAAAREIRDRVTDEGAVVPELWPIEMGNAFVYAVRDRRISLKQRADAFETLGQLPIETDRETLAYIRTNTLVLADRFQLTLYDACYLELAQRRNLPLATRDKAMRAAGTKLKVSLI